MNFKKTYKKASGYTPLCKIGECSLKKLDEAKAYTDTMTSNKADTNHTHDTLYYTKSAIDEALEQKTQVQICVWEADD